ncbi:nucleoside triphosphate pyrophosphohydrolase [Bacillus sp. FJAT-45350]|uniref:nucleoside triphosphate pyrophosphohydrolase n=1 Tax=Bacillus sp. FJAT-45350 TaxID=2011014 RepID=UPI000BB84CBC|nr:nucleoside triphosphate pyrophosphohydrolase [Bacillus sp. FJAT-45350]
MNKISIFGLGAGDLEQMPLGIYKKILQAKPLYLRTKHHPAVTELEKEGLRYKSFDDVYEANEQFGDVYRTIADSLFEAAQEGDVSYAVPGHPLVAEQTVQFLLQESEENQIQVEVEVVGGQSFLDPMYTALKIDPIDGCQVVDGTMLRREALQVRQHIIICQVYDAFIASEVKLTLMQLLPDDYEVVVATAVGSAEESLVTVPLYELDRVATLNNLTAVYVPPVEDETVLYQDFSMLRSVIATLRGPNGCPWDIKQTHKSLKPYLIEEAYEVIEAIDEEDDDHLAEELGDVLLQVMLHAQIGEDEGWFTIDDVIETLTEKMIRRHPHVFGTGQAEDADEVVKNWEQIKQEERGEEAKYDSILANIPTSFPALMRAFKLQKKAAKVGFDWDEAAPMWMKLQEEISEFFAEIKNNDKTKMTKEFGDILFVLVNLARFYNIQPEEALHGTNEKFYNRFQIIEQELQNRGLEFSDVTLEELDEIWEKSKKDYR